MGRIGAVVSGDGGVGAGDALTEFARVQPSLRALLEPLARAAASKAPILLRGESGSGRSTLARALHQASGRQPLVESDVGLIQATLFEGELFGYVRGAFTGAESSRAGLVARADGGTLLLDRIEEMPLPLQPKLLRLLAESRFSPLGGRERGADVRYISIASTELDQRLASGSFREDLFYRLEVLSFVVPPLRARRGDIGPLLDSMCSDASERYGKPGLVLDQTTRAWMLEYDWPGNLRELRNTVERAVVLHESGPVVIDAPRHRRREKPVSLARLEADAILAALRYTAGHQGRAAALLGISRKTLWDKRKRYDIP